MRHQITELAPPNVEPLHGNSLAYPQSCYQDINLSKESPFELISASSRSKASVNCTYNITAHENGEIIIEFQDFDMNGAKLGQNADCLNTDHVVVEQKMGYLGWRQVRRYCGDWTSQLKAIHVVTKVSSLRIRSFLAPMHENEAKPRGFVAKVRVSSTNSSRG